MIFIKKIKNSELNFRVLMDFLFRVLIEFTDCCLQIGKPLSKSIIFYDLGLPATCRLQRHWLVNETFWNVHRKSSMRVKAKIRIINDHIARYE